MKNRALTFEPEIVSIIKKCEACTLSMVDTHGMPYAVPMNFGFENRRLFLHAAPEGRKIEILKHNPHVCITFSTDHELRWQNTEVACSYSMKYRSVMILGEIKFLEEMDEKQQALDVIMHQYTDNPFKYSEPALKNVCVMEVIIKEMTGKAYGY
ncbi:MAG: pyridoxamine 5'-phosphate oxidase family protein [Bacteroidetes bacterium]|nr:pyridoxamine 5'-phosphate oxidase family protein [Bacteroidota bacterium]MBU1579339.1 pyridoxamine 5'-phosphate oxidase family protein [Bacteroidota bacterium]MBU2558437.1 pyridoxamine 5'-phosphate oxidase family protein [Bacteroidota bacterium]